MFSSDLRLLKIMHDPNIQTDVKNEGFLFFFFHLEEILYISGFDFASIIEAFFYVCAHFLSMCTHVKALMDWQNRSPNRALIECE